MWCDPHSSPLSREQAQLDLKLAGDAVTALQDEIDAFRLTYENVLTEDKAGDKAGAADDPTTSSSTAAATAAASSAIASPAHASAGAAAASPVRSAVGPDRNDSRL